MQPISSSPSSPLPLRFGQSGIASGSLATGAATLLDKALGPLSRSRTTGLLAEDFVGFGLLRTWMDWRRGKTYGSEQNNNLAAAERITRESISIFTDNILPGLVALGVGRLAQGTQGLSNQFIDEQTLKLFQQATQGAHSEADFLKNLSQALSQDHPEAQPAAVQKTLANAWKNGQHKTTVPWKVNLGLQTDAQLEARLNEAQQLLKQLGKKQAKSFTHTITTSGKPASLQLDNFLDDITRFSRATSASLNLSTNAKTWSQTARQAIQQTLQIQKRSIPSAMLIAMGATFAAPFIISELTRRWTGVDYYPGEIGLHTPQQNALQTPSQPTPSSSNKNFLERHFPYLVNAWRQGSCLPLLGAIAPLGLTFLNTERMSAGESMKKWWVSPKKLSSLLSFQKGFPHTTQQQMATLFALLISSRLFNARSDNEYRERLVDSLAGWGIWILGTPLLKRAAAVFADKKLGTQLQDGIRLRSRVEIEKFLTGDVLKKTRNLHTLIGSGSMILTIILLGIVEPWIGIKWTQHNEQKKQAQRQSTTPSLPLPPAAQTAGYRPSTGRSSIPFMPATPFSSTPSGSTSQGMPFFTAFPSTTATRIPFNPPAPFVPPSFQQLAPTLQLPPNPQHGSF